MRRHRRLTQTDTMFPGTTLFRSLALGGRAGWYFKLQVLDHADYAKRSEANRIKQRPVVPARGIIYDRKGRILADNVPELRLDVVPADARDPKALVAGLSPIIALRTEPTDSLAQDTTCRRSFRQGTLKPPRYPH